MYGDELPTTEALNGRELVKLKEAMNTKTRTMESMHFWDMVDPAKHQNILHWKYFLRRKHDAYEDILKYKEHFVVGSTNEFNDDESLYPVTDFTTVNLTLRLTIQNQWHARYLYFQNVFPNGTLGRSVYVYPRRNVSKETIYWNRVLNLKISLYVLKDAAKIWYATVSFQFWKFFLRDMETAPCVYKKQGMVVIRYVQSLLVLSRQKSQIESFKSTLLDRFVVNYLVDP